MVCRRLGLDREGLCSYVPSTRHPNGTLYPFLFVLFSPAATVKPLPPRASVQLRGIRASVGNSDRCVRVARTNRADLSPGGVNICFCATPGPDGPARSLKFKKSAYFLCFIEVLPC